MANHLDLEEQEQIDQLKHFWNTWGTLISAVLFLVFGSMAIWNGYQYWKNKQSTQAAALLEELHASIRTKDDARVEQALNDIREKYSSTQQAVQAGLLASKQAQENSDKVTSKVKPEDALSWVATSGADEGYKAVARLRLSSLMMEKAEYDEALKQLSFVFPPEFEAIVADRQGDIQMLQKKPTEATQKYLRAYEKSSNNPEYKRLVEFKLNALGINPSSPTVASSGKGATG